MTRDNPDCGVKRAARVGSYRGFVFASLVADEVQPGMTVILDGGSTTYAVARLLAEKRVQIITNSLPVASLFGEIGHMETIVTGGSIAGRLGVHGGGQAGCGQHQGKQVRRCFHCLAG